jgi:alkylation response protein AidB-like acyl-CoA dehydrogenase
MWTIVQNTEPSEVEQFRAAFVEWLRTAPLVSRLRGANPPELPLLREWQRELAKGGWLAVHWPTDAGGRGLSILHQVSVYEEIARARLPQPPGIIGLEVVGGTLASNGTPEQRARWLPGLLSADELWCQGFSEPDAGSDLASLRTRAVRDGDEFVVSGQKVWTTMGDVAEWCVALVRTGTTESRHRGISYLVIDMASPGVTVHPLSTVTGESEFSEVFFDDVRCPVGNLVGPLDGGWALAMDTLANERGGYVLRRCAELQVMFGDIVTQLRTEVGAGAEPDYAALGECRILLDELAAQSRKTVARMSANRGPSPLDSVDKLLITSTEQALTGFALDHFGLGRMTATSGSGGSVAADWTNHYLWGRASSIYSGTRQIQRSIVAERILGLPKGR